MKTVSYHQIDALESDYLHVEVSQLINAGNGLYTAIDIYKDERIAVFHGKKLTSNQSEKLSGQGLDQYFMMLPDNRILDCRTVACFAKYANDAAVHPSGFKNNAKIAFDEENKVSLIALRKIKSGEEIFCSYGKPYWKKHL